MDRTIDDMDSLFITLLVIHEKDVDAEALLSERISSEQGLIHSVFACKNLMGQSLGFTYFHIEKALAKAPLPSASTTIICGKHIFRVFCSEVKDASHEPGSVIFNNLEKNINKDGLFTICLDFGSIVSVEIKSTSNLGIVHFERKESAIHCVSEMENRLLNDQEVHPDIFPSTEMLQTMVLGSTKENCQFIHENLLFCLMIHGAINQMKCYLQEAILEIRRLSIRSYQKQVETMVHSNQRKTGATTIHASFKFNLQAVKDNVATLNELATEQFTEKRAAEPMPGTDTLKNIELTLYADGIQWSNGAFISFDAMDARQCVQDLLDGFIPSALKKSFPNGVIISIKDLHDTNCISTQHNYIPQTGFRNISPQAPHHLMPQFLPVQPPQTLYYGMPFGNQQNVNWPKLLNQQQTMLSNRPGPTVVTRPQTIPHEDTPKESTLTMSMLNRAPAVEQKQMLGEALYPLIQKQSGNLAGKITGMLLEIDNSELLYMLNKSPEHLHQKVEEASAVLRANQHSTKERREKENKCYENESLNLISKPEKEIDLDVGIGTESRNSQQTNTWAKVVKG